MFTTCFFCAATLPRNDIIEATPIGRRLAFNERTGRLWVVCRACDRWNLVPMHERWEGVESCERLFRASRTHVATGEISLARAAGGIDLIRIGAPLRPEFAAWRYGDQFGRRRRRQIALAALAVPATAAAIAAGASFFGGAILTTVVLHTLRRRLLEPGYRLGGDAVHGRPSTVVARVRDESGAVLRVERQDARSTRMLRPELTGGSFALVLHHHSEKLPGGMGLPWYPSSETVLTGSAAVRAAQQLLPAVNRFGSTKERVSDAVSLIESSGGPDRVLHSLASRRGQRSIDWSEGYALDEAAPEHERSRSLVYLPPAERLALEMALHEESERRAMDGELAALEAAWREAEEIARIADAL